MSGSSRRLTTESLEKLYARFNHRRFVHPDPLEFLYDYGEPEDQEIVALIASSLAYGRVQQILKSVSRVLDTVGEPSHYVERTSRSEMRHDFLDFKHRFTTGDDMAELLFGVGRVVREHGSLGRCLAGGISPGDESVERGLSHFAQELTSHSSHGYTSLIPNPEKGSACKRLNLMLRWLVRKDEVDPGGWEFIDKSKLIIPLDVHMHRIALEHGLTARKNANMRAALEITKGYAKFSPEDPTRYDFALTRPGIGGHSVTSDQSPAE